jgi:hypothetical protein
MMEDGLKQKYENAAQRRKRIWRQDKDGTETFVISVT